jgi:hypothetical protein
MWTATVHGFFSAVSKPPYPGQTVPGYNPHMEVAIRARAKEDLENLLSALTSAEREECTQIISGGSTDYPYRIFATRSVWIAYLSRYIGDMDYGNFKNAVKKKSPQHARVYGNVWGALLQLEQLNRFER